MDPEAALGVTTLLMGGAGALELWAHRRNLTRVPVRIHVNGTRGKSSVTRLIAAGLRAHGLRVVAKTTGTTARILLADGRELPVPRPAGPNIIEQKGVVRLAARAGAQVLVVECMALRPELQRISETRLLQATHGVITNVRPDHLEVMGPGVDQVALALGGTVPRGGVLYTAEHTHAALLERISRARTARFEHVGPEHAARVTARELAGFSYIEHAENVALALRVCEDLGALRDVALAAMQTCSPDPGALRVYQLERAGVRLSFWLAFAANDPVSSASLWELAAARTPQVSERLVVFNCRDDRPERSQQLGAAVARLRGVDRLFVIGSGTAVFARAARSAGFPSERLELLEHAPPPQIVAALLARAGPDLLAFGMGNIGGSGLALAEHIAAASGTGEPI